jgi:hypothetical protein
MANTEANSEAFKELNQTTQKIPGGNLDTR